MRLAAKLRPISNHRILNRLQVGTSFFGPIQQLTQLRESGHLFWPLVTSLYAFVAFHWLSHEEKSRGLYCKETRAHLPAKHQPILFKPTNGNQTQPQTDSRSFSRPHISVPFKRWAARNHYRTSTIGFLVVQFGHVSNIRATSLRRSLNSFFCFEPKWAVDQR